jgi:hypothetical protein
MAQTGWQDERFGRARGEQEKSQAKIPRCETGTWGTRLLLFENLFHQQVNFREFAS